MGNKPLDTADMIESTDNFEAAYESHAPTIYKFMYWRTRDAQLSEDLTSSVFLKAWRSRSKFGGGSVRTWLYRIARNTLTDHWRKKKELFVEDTDALEADAKPTTAELLDRDAQLQRMRQALDKLPSDMRTVLTLRFIEGMSSKKVAATLGLSDANVRVMQYRALRKLRGYLP